jgi:hypothetical protein
MPSREKGRKACQLQLVGHFLQSGLRARIAKFRPFPAILREIQADFSALQTVWRRGRHSNLRYGFEMAQLPCAWLRRRIFVRI